MTDKEKADKFDYLIQHFQAILDASSHEGKYNQGFCDCMELVIDYMKN